MWLVFKNNYWIVPSYAANISSSGSQIPESYSGFPPFTAGSKARTNQNVLTQNVNKLNVIQVYIYTITWCCTPGIRVFRNTGLVILWARVLQHISACLLYSFPVNFTCDFLLTNSILFFSSRHSSISFPSSFSPILCWCIFIKVSWKVHI